METDRTLVIDADPLIYSERPPDGEARPSPVAVKHTREESEFLAELRTQYGPRDVSVVPSIPTDRTLVIDADPLIYRFASTMAGISKMGSAIRFDVNEEAACDALEEEVDRILAAAGSPHTLLMALSCGVSWRRRVYPEYKMNRDPHDKPELLPKVRAYVEKRFTCVGWPELEADDVIGILATVAQPCEFASIDKDMFGVPGRFLHCRVKASGDDEYPPITPYTISIEEADRFHLLQTLIGDRTDNYPGCPGVGEKRAPKMIEGKDPAKSMLAAFRMKGVSEHDAIAQAVAARILRADDFIPDASAIRLWTVPPRVRGSLVLDMPSEDDRLAHEFLAQIVKRRERLVRSVEHTVIAPTSAPTQDSDMKDTADDDTIVIEADTGEEPAVEPSTDADSASAPTGPFLSSEGHARRVKLLLWGDSGVGKTPLAIRFPKPCVIDMENGAEPYEGDPAFPFARFAAETPEQVDEALAFLQEGRHEFETLVIDPITVYWEALQAKWNQIFLLRNKNRAGYKHEFYELGGREWSTIKSEWKSFTRRLSMLGMNVVAIARIKPLYASGGNMQVIGDIYDCEKSTKYLFDTAIKLTGFDFEANTIQGECLRDRYRRIPQGAIDISVDEFIGKMGTNAPIAPVQLATDEQAAEFDTLVEDLSLDAAVISKRLAHYGVNSASDLKRSDIETILTKLRAAQAARA